MNPSDLANLNWRNEEDGDRWPEDDELISDALVLLRIVDPKDGSMSMLMLSTRGTDGIIQYGMLGTSLEIAKSQWVQK